MTEVLYDVYRQDKKIFSGLTRKEIEKEIYKGYSIPNFEDYIDKWWPLVDGYYHIFRTDTDPFKGMHKMSARYCTGCAFRDQTRYYKNTMPRYCLYYPMTGQYREAPYGWCCKKMKLEDWQTAQEIMKLHKNGILESHIASRYHLTETTVKKIIKRFNEIKPISEMED